ncbi:MAG: DEAD/DEAH box helicase [Opitutaceae bacterium]|nr:DEAD/DEAH box helicase [Opitutaceae bacterium]
MIRVLLPPNLESAAARDAIPLKVELDLDSPLKPEFLPALAALQRFGAKSSPALFLQLKRGQLRELVTLLKGLPVFFRMTDPNRPLTWVGHVLRGASEFLGDSYPSAQPPLNQGASPLIPRSVRASPAAKAPSSSSSVSPAMVDGSEHYLSFALPSREHASYAPLLELLKSSGFTLEPSNRRWWLRDRNRALNFLAAHGTTLRSDFRVAFTDNFIRNTSHLHTAEIAADAIETRGGFTVSLGLRAGRADDSLVQSALAANRGYVENDGKIYLLDPRQLEKLSQAQRALSGEAGPHVPAIRCVHRLGAAHLPVAQEILQELAPGFELPATWKARSEALSNLSKLQPVSLPEPLNSLLRPYQHLGAAWLTHLRRNQLAGVLADEMGLGKTLQALAMIASTIADAKEGGHPVTTCLVVCPASLLENWRRECVRFAPHLRVHVHHGAARISEAEHLRGFDILLTSYGTLVRDREIMAEVEFACIVADEAQHVKNRRSQNAQALRSLRSRGRCVLTGTPMENSLDDLRSLFEFLMPGYLKPVPAGMRGEERSWLDERLHAQTAPYILRRTKHAVASELPAKIEQVIWCELSPEQSALYRAVKEQTERDIDRLQSTGASEQALRLATFTQLLRLRQVCCDPRLLGETAPPAPGGAGPASHSAKLEAFRELLAEALDDGHRLLVFSQFTSLLTLLKAELDAQGLAYASLDGSMSPRARQAEVDRFQNSPDISVFLLSLKAGGTGLNLTAADTVVHFDPWWNPAVEAQATDRAHRIGQHRVVTSYKLICSGTVEEKVLALQEAKRALLSGVFEASDAASSRLSLADLRDLIRD